MITYQMCVSHHEYKRLREICVDMNLIFYPGKLANVIQLTIYFETNKQAHEYNRRVRCFSLSSFSEKDATKINWLKKVINHCKYYITTLFDRRKNALHS